MGSLEPREQGHDRVDVATNLDATFAQRTRAVEGASGEGQRVAVGESDDRVSRQVVTALGASPVGAHREGERVRPVGGRVRELEHDAQGCTLAAASSLDKELKSNLKTGADKDAAAAVGKLIAERSKEAGVTQVVFDRGSYLYHGRVKALAEAAREGGLDF